jgi:hypothetical protein
MTTPASNTARKQRAAVRDAQGRIRVLAVGVGEHLKKSGFPSLKQCVSDAAQVHAAFAETPQLNADPAYLVLMSSKTTSRPPSRGQILDELQELADGAQPEDRVLFYFSGHGHRLPGDDDLFLVPQDAYSDSDAHALVSFAKVIDIVSASPAKHKIVILDACLSGPSLSGKKLQAAKISDTFLASYLKESQGLAVLSSSAADESSYTKSDRPDLSLFTSYLVPGLRGDPEAMDDDQIMTVQTLYQFVETAVKRKAKSMRLHQTPSIHVRANAELVLGDFRPPLVPQALSSATFAGSGGIAFSDRRGDSTKAILTNWNNRSLTAEQLEYAANQAAAMEAYTKESFARWRVDLRRQFRYDRGEIEVSAGSLAFPGGRLSYRYESNTKDRGSIVRDLELDAEWFADLTRLGPLLELFKMRPSAFAVKLREAVEPLNYATALEAAGWQIESEAEDEVVANAEQIEVKLSPLHVAFSGVDVSALFDRDVESTPQHRIIATTIATLAR